MGEKIQNDFHSSRELDSPLFNWRRIIEMKKLIGWLVGWLIMFYNITRFGYLIPNLIYTYILDIYDFETNRWLVTIFQPGLNCVHTVKWFQVLLSKINRSICIQLNRTKYFHVIPIIHFNIH